jgi:hypothetical protein
MVFKKYFSDINDQYMGPNICFYHIQHTIFFMHIIFQKLSLISFFSGGTKALWYVTYSHLFWFVLFFSFFFLYHCSLESTTKAWAKNPKISILDPHGHPQSISISIYIDWPLAIFQKSSSKKQDICQGATRSPKDQKICYY